MKGNDISNWQGNNINFNAARADGMEGCIIKATESTYFVNQYFNYQVNGALNAGCKVGFYHFFRGNGVAEANYFCQVIKPYINRMSFKPVIDVEAQCANINYEVLAFINRVKEILGCDCTIYSGAYFAGDNLTDNRLTKYPLWVAHYGVASDEVAKRGIWKNVQIAGHQYSDCEKVNGFGGGIDGDVFYDAMLLDGKVSVDDKPFIPPVVNKRVKNSDGTYTVKSGDTLGEIASDFGVNYLDLAKYSNIVNPNNISVGQIIYFAPKVVNKPVEVASNIYVVKSGDTLSEIANRYGVSLNAIVQANGIANANVIYVGQQIKIPNGNPQLQPQAIYYNIQYGDNLSTIANKYGVSVASICNLNGIANANLIYAGQRIRIK